MMPFAPVRARVRGMSTTIMAGFDPSRDDRAPVEFAAVVSGATGDELLIVVVQAGGNGLDRLSGGELADQPGAAGNGEDPAEALATELRGRGVTASVQRVGHHSAARGLAHAVAEVKPRLLVLGSAHHAEHGHVRPGGTAERLLAGSPCPVAVVPRGHEIRAGGIKVVGVAFAPTREGREALHLAAELAQVRHALLRVIMVLDPKHASEQSSGMMAGQHGDTDPAEAIAGRHRLEARSVLDTAIAELAPGVETDVDVLFQDPAEGLVAASRNVDLLVMGSRGYGPMRSVMLGGVSRRVVVQSACPVVVVPRGADATAESLMASVDTATPAE
jgi:nucleotide-binding universal stress UspA family protein